MRLTKDRRIKLRVMFEDARAEYYALWRIYSNKLASAIDEEDAKFAEPRRESFRNVVWLLDAHARTRSEGQLLNGVVKVRDEMVKTRNSLDRSINELKEQHKDSEYKEALREQTVYILESLRTLIFNLNYI